MKYFSLTLTTCGQNVLATQMLNHHEQANEYKKKFIKLIEAERLVHEGVLKRYDVYVIILTIRG